MCYMAVPYALSQHLRRFLAWIMFMILINKGLQTWEWGLGHEVDNAQRSDDAMHDDGKKGIYSPTYEERHRQTPTCGHQI